MSTASSNLWGNIISSVGVFVVTAGLLGTWVNQRVTPIEARIDAIDRKLDRIDQQMTPILTLQAQRNSDTSIMGSMQKDMDSKVSSELFATFRDTVTKQMDTDKANLLRLMDEMSHQVHSLEGKIVSRDENKEHWDAETSARDDINKRLDYLNSRINSLTFATSPAAPSPPGSR